MKSLTSTAAVLAAFGGVASAWSGAAAAQDAPAAYQVVRVGDGQMSCEALVAQINALSAEADAARSAAVAGAVAAQQRAASRAQGGQTAKRLALGGLAGGLAYMPFGGGLASFAVRSAAVNAANAAAVGTDVVQVNTAAPEVAESPQAKRLTHLNAILQRKGC